MSRRKQIALYSRVFVVTEFVVSKAKCKRHYCNIVPTFLPPATKLGQGNIFRSVCQQFWPQGGVACVAARGGGRAWLHGGNAWFYSGGGHAWFFQFFRIQWDTANERAVRILLECILVDRKREKSSKEVTAQKEVLLFVTEYEMRPLQGW